MKTKYLFYFSLFIFFLNQVPIHSQNTRFLLKDYKVNDAYIYSYGMNMAISANIKFKGSAEGELSTNLSYSKNLKVNELISGAANRSVSQLQVFYEKAEEMTKDGDNEQLKSESVSGKTYIIYVKGNESNILYPNNERPEKAEMDYIDINNLIDPIGINENFNGTALMPGDKAPLLGPKIISAISGDSSVKLNNMEIIFKEARSVNGINYGVFEINIDLVFNLDQNSTRQMKLSGELLLSSDNIIIFSLNMEGIVSMKSQNEEMTLSGDGNAQINISREYVKK